MYLIRHQRPLPSGYRAAVVYLPRRQVIFDEAFLICFVNAMCSVHVLQ